MKNLVSLALTAFLAPCLFGPIACSGSSSSAPSGPHYPTCTDSPDVVFAGAAVQGAYAAGVSSAPTRLVPLGDTLYYFTPNAQEPLHTVDLQSITPWGTQVTILTYQQATSALWTDGSNLHWMTATGIATQVPGGQLSEASSTLGFVPLPVTNDATNVYAITSLGAGPALVSQNVFGGPLVTLASFASLGTFQTLYDGGDHVVVLDGSDIYSVPKDGSAMARYALPANVTQVWNLADPTSLYVSTTTDAGTGAGELGKYAFGGAVTPLSWAKDSAPVFIESVATGANGSVAFSGLLTKGDVSAGLALGVASATQPASIAWCLDEGFFVGTTLVTSSAIYSVVTTSEDTADWKLVKWPTGG